MPKAPQMETVQSPLMSCVGGPCFAAVGDNVEDAAPVYAQLCIFSETRIVTYFIASIVLYYILVYSIMVFLVTQLTSF